MDKLEGEGFITNMIDYLKKTPRELLRKRPKIINDLIVSKGNVEISHIQICRMEIWTSIRRILNLVTFGRLQKQMKRLNYDKLFHLYMVLYLKDGSTIGIEKNERVRVWKNPKTDKRADCKMHFVRKKLSLKTFIENGEKLGGEDFYRYSSHFNNCQRFVNELLVSNGIRHMSKFVMQDVSELFSEAYKKLFQGITDVASLARYAYEGGEIKN